MRTSIALVAGGELIALIGIGLWSVAAALLVLGLELVALGLLRESRATAAQKRPAKAPSRVSAGLHRRRASIRRLSGRARTPLRLIRGAAS